MSDVARFRHLSLRTEEAYRKWIKRFILLHGKRHPRDLDAEAVRSFLTHLAVKENVAASMQNQAFNALLFLYRQVLKLELPNIDGVERSRRSRPTICSTASDGNTANSAQRQGGRSRQRAAERRQNVAQGERGPHAGSPRGVLVRAQRA